jgi:hypothetical protein
MQVQHFLRLWDSLRIPELIGSLFNGCAPPAKHAFGQGELKKANQSMAILLLQRIILGRPYHEYCICFCISKACMPYTGLITVHECPKAELWFFALQSCDWCLL